MNSLNVIRRLREHVGLTQKSLAERCGTSQPTIASYESGKKSPTVTTLQRLSMALGLDLVVAFTPRMTREDLRSLAYHKEIAKGLQQLPGSTIRRTKQTLIRMSKKHPEATVLFQRWKRWLNLPLEELISHILDPGTLARDMRQVSPFAGILSSEKRAKILTKFRGEYRQ